LRKRAFIVAIVSLLFSFKVEADSCDERAVARVEAAVSDELLEMDQSERTALIAADLGVHQGGQQERSRLLFRQP